MTDAEDALARLRAAFLAPEPARGLPARGASAVLIPLFGEGADLRVLYTERSESLSRHAGEVSFPGGRIDPGDAGPLAAALREAHEEVGIRPEDVDVLGHVVDFTTFYGRAIHAYVGHVRAPPPEKPASPAEVARIFLIPLRTLLDPATHEGRTYDGRIVHYFHVEPRTVWGITGELTALFLSRAYGWEPAGEVRQITDVTGFMP